MVLGKAERFANLTVKESDAFLSLFPHAIVDKAIVCDRLLLSGVVYTNKSYTQTKSNDYTIVFKDGKIGKAVKYILIEDQDVYLVLVQECVSVSGPCSHIKVVTDTM